MTVDPKHRHSNEDIYDDFKLKNPLVTMIYTELFQRFKG